MKKSMLFICFVLLNLGGISAQLCTANGFDLSAQGDLKILFVFAEVDCSTCPTQGPLTREDVCNYGASWEDWESSTGGWPRLSLPLNADTWIDYDATQPFTTYISKFYDEVTFGNLNVTGDYYPSVLTVDCDKFINNTNDAQVQAVLQQLNEEYSNNNPDFVTTARGGVIYRILISCLMKELGGRLNRNSLIMK